MTIYTGGIPKSIFAVGAVSKSLSSTASMQKSVYSVASTLFVSGVVGNHWQWADGSALLWADGTYMGVEHV